MLLFCWFSSRNFVAAALKLQSPYAVQPRFAGIVDPFRKLFLRFGEITRSSAFANSRSSDPLVDMPDPTAFGEAERFT